MKPYVRGWKHHATVRTTWDDPPVIPEKVKEVCLQPKIVYQPCKTPGLHTPFFWPKTQPGERGPGQMQCHICNWEIIFGYGEPSHIRNYPKRMRKSIVDTLVRDRDIHIYYDPNEDNDPI